MQDSGAGEIVVNSVDRDGLMQGYNLDLAEKLSKAIQVPLTFLGGAGQLEHISDLISNVGVVGAAAGSLFVFKGKYRAVLLNYPSFVQKRKLCLEALENYKNR
jgi:cyclase